MIFYLGTTEYWLARTDAPLFCNYHWLWTMEQKRKSPFRPATTKWCIDSGGFTELKTKGKWTIPPRQYVRSLRRYVEEIGNLQWCAPQDWMCEDVILQKTGLTVRIHQRKTVESVLELRNLAPELPFVPVLQGWLLSQYLEHIEMYEAAGINLRAEPLVCLGTMCRRQDSIRAAFIIRELVEQGLRCHALGAKTTGLSYYAPLIASADSDAWSFVARAASNRHRKLHGTKLPGGKIVGPGVRMLPTCTHASTSCNNCFDWAMHWRKQVLAEVPGPNAPLSEADRNTLHEGSRVRAESGGELIAPFGST